MTTEPNFTYIAGTASLPATTPPGIQLRPMEVSDAVEIAELWMTAYPPEVVGGESVATVEADIVAAMDGEYGPFLQSASPIAMRADGAIVGSLQTVADTSWDRTPRGPFILDIFVSPDARRSGVARALLRFAKHALHAQGMGTVGLRVLRDNEAARVLYESEDFREWRP